MASEPAPKPKFLTDVIVELGFASQETVRKAVEAARITNKTADQILVEHGDITQEQLSRALAERYGAEFVDLSSYPVDQNASQMVTRSVADRCHAVPIAFAAADQLVVAISDSAGASAIGDMAALTRMRIKPVVADAAQIDALIQELPELESNRPPRERRGARQQAAQQQHAQQQTPPADPQRQPAGGQPSQPQQPAVPGDSAAGLEPQLMEQVMRLSDTSQEVDLSPDLKLVDDDLAAEGSEQEMAALRSELAHLLELEQDFRSTIEQVSERLRRTGFVAGNERVSGLEEELKAAKQAQLEAERERDELRQRLAAIRGALGGGQLPT